MPSVAPLPQLVVDQHNCTKSKGDKVVLYWHLRSCQGGVNCRDVVDNERYRKCEWDHHKDVLVLQWGVLENAEISGPHGKQIEELHNDQIDEVNRRRHVDDFVNTR